MMRSLAVFLYVVSASFPVSALTVSPDDRPPAATVKVVRASQGDCSARWEGEDITSEELYDRSIHILELVVDEVGVENLTYDNMPFLRLEAAPEVAWSCLLPAIDVLQRVGFVGVALRPDTDPTAREVFLYFTLHGGPPTTLSVILELGQAGSMTWNGERIELVGLRERTSLLRNQQAPTGAHVIRLSADAEFATLYAMLREAGAAFALDHPQESPPPPAASL